MLEDVEFYMRVPLPDGSFTNGKIDYTKVPAELGIAELDCNGLRVLDIAANDGFWTFWAEQRGAEELLAIDVDGFEHYDWSYGGPPNAVRKTFGKSPSNWSAAGAGFRALHEAWKSKARRETLSVYDLSPEAYGNFDLVFNFGLLYHLRHPLLSLDRARSVCSGVMFLETHVVNGFFDLPVNLFYQRDELHTVTNWTGPTVSCVANWLKSAGFARVFSNRTNTASPYARRIFVACVSDSWAYRFAESPRLQELDDEYLNMTRAKTRMILGVDK